jgi:hypothetical protein
MMIFTRQDIKQDTIQAFKQDTITNYNVQDTVYILKDTAPLQNDSSPVITPRQKPFVPKIKSFVYSDSTSVCSKNSIIDLTFHDRDNIGLITNASSLNKFPFIFTAKNRQIQAEAKASIVKQLRPGENLPAKSINGDWIIVIVILAAVLYSLVITNSKNLLPGVSRFFLFRGINDPSSRNLGGLFHWQSTIINFVSFLIISLFIYTSVEYYEFIPPGLNRLTVWLIILGLIMLVVTLRHITCIITGNASGQNEAFREYLLAVYQSYRFTALFLFIIIIMVSYTEFFTEPTWFISGIIVFGIMYLIRVTRLLVIFLNRNISIFYLILYLCALEILPVLITGKFFSGLIKVWTGLL